MSTDNLDKLKSNQVLELIRVAYEYCVFTEEIEKHDLKTILSFYQKILPLLYLKGALLPDIEVSDKSFNERYVSEEHWENVFVNLQAKLGKEEHFWTVDNNREMLKISIAEYLADIYQDLKDFVVLFQNNRLAAKENAVFEVKRYFQVHWGARLSAVIPVFHNILYAQEILKNEHSEI